MIFVILLYALSATTFIFSKILLTCMAPLLLTAVRTLCAGFGLLVYLYIIRGELAVRRTLFLTCLQIAFFSFYISNSVKFYALVHITPLKASLLAMSEPLFGLVIAYFLCNERISIKKLLGLLICVCGALSLNNLFCVSTIQTINGLTTWYECLLVVAIAASAYGAILMRIAIRNHGMSVVQVNGLSMFLAGVGALFTSFIIQGQPVMAITPEHGLIYFGFVLIAMIMISNVIGYNLYGMLLKKYSVMFISAASFLRPFFTALYKWILFNEAIELSLFFSIAIIGVGLYILYKEEIVEESTALITLKSKAIE